MYVFFFSALAIHCVSWKICCYTYWSAQHIFHCHTVWFDYVSLDRVRQTKWHPVLWLQRTLNSRNCTIGKTKLFHLLARSTQTGCMRTSETTRCDDKALLYTQWLSYVCCRCEGFSPLLTFNSVDGVLQLFIPNIHSIYKYTEISFKSQIKWSR